MRQLFSVNLWFSKLKHLLQLHLRPGGFQFLLVPIFIGIHTSLILSRLDRDRKELWNFLFRLGDYFSSTFAPAVSSFFFASSAVFLFTPLSTSLGALSTRVLAS